MEGVMTFKYEFVLNNQVYIIRIYPEARSRIAKLEFDILQQVYNKGCKVPEVVVNGSFKEVDYLIYKKLPGQSLNKLLLLLPEHAKTNLLREIGENISKLAELTYSSFGDLGKNNAAFETWSSFLVDSVREGRIILSRKELITGLDLVQLDKFLAALTRHVDVTVSSLVWSDFSQDNIIINGEKLSGFIDFEGVFAGDPRMSFGYLFAREGESDFFKGILVNSRIPGLDQEVIMYYAIIRVLRIIKYQSFPLPSGQKRDKLENYFKGLPSIISFINQF